MQSLVANPVIFTANVEPLGPFHAQFMGAVEDGPTTSTSHCSLGPLLTNSIYCTGQRCMVYIYVCMPVLVPICFGHKHVS